MVKGLQALPAAQPVQHAAQRNTFTASVCRDIADMSLALHTLTYSNMHTPPAYNKAPLPLPLRRAKSSGHDVLLAGGMPAPTMRVHTVQAQHMPPSRCALRARQATAACWLAGVVRGLWRQPWPRAAHIYIKRVPHALETHVRCMHVEQLRHAQCNVLDFLRASVRCLSPARWSRFCSRRLWAPTPLPRFLL